MSDKELYQQRLQAQLDEWQAEIDKLKAKAEGAGAETKLEMNRQIEELESKVEDARGKLSELSLASDLAWESLKEGVEMAWESLKSAFNKTSTRFK